MPIQPNGQIDGSHLAQQVKQRRSDYAPADGGEAAVAGRPGRSALAQPQGRVQHAGTARPADQACRAGSTPRVQAGASGHLPTPDKRFHGYRRHVPHREADHREPDQREAG
jgi:hypothetical protein